MVVSPFAYITTRLVDDSDNAPLVESTEDNVIAMSCSSQLVGTSLFAVH